MMAQEQKQKSKAPKEHSMTGCLEQGSQPNTFKLTHVEGGKVAMVDIPETTANLTPHIGHKVEVTGTAIQGQQGVHTMKITAVKMISATCP